MRQFSWVDQVILKFDSLLARPGESNPTARSIRLMRVNHSGEVSAQALYRAQGWMARDPKLKYEMKVAACEEEEHLKLCAKRLEALGGRTSLLTPVWAVGSFAIGTLAGLMGDKQSLGFLAETEFQVTEHLERHLEELPVEDEESRKVLLKMREDELRHATHALEEGGVSLSPPIRFLMKLASKVMTFTARYV